MAVRFGFYNSSNGDRKYNAEDMGAIFDGIITDGVFDNVEGLLATVAGSGLQVLVKTGRAWFDHTWTINDAVLPLSIDPPDVILDRYDAVVLETDYSITARKNSIKIVKGVPAANPVWPSLINTNYVKHHPLAYVKVMHGATQISPSNIDIRVGKSDCPYVTGILTTVSINDLFNSWQADFDAWFDNIQTVISTDTVTNLQRQIDLKLNKSDKATSAEVSAGANDTKYITPAAIKTQLDEAASTVKDVSTGKAVKLISKMDSLYIKPLQYGRLFSSFSNISGLTIPGAQFASSSFGEVLIFGAQKNPSANTIDLLINTINYNDFTNSSYLTVNTTYNAVNLDAINQYGLNVFLLPGIKNQKYPIVGVSYQYSSTLLTSSPMAIVDLRRKTYRAIYQTSENALNAVASYLAAKKPFSSNSGNIIYGYLAYCTTDYLVYRDPTVTSTNTDSTNIDWCVHPLGDNTNWGNPSQAIYKFSLRSSAILIGEGNDNELWFMRINTGIIYIDRVILSNSSATISESVQTISFSSTNSLGAGIQLWVNGLIGDWFTCTVARYTNNATPYYSKGPVLFNYKTLAVLNPYNTTGNYFTFTGSSAFARFQNTTFGEDILGSGYVNGKTYYALANGTIFRDSGGSGSPTITPSPIQNMAAGLENNFTKTTKNYIKTPNTTSKYFTANDALYAINVDGTNAYLEKLIPKIDCGEQTYRKCGTISVGNQIPANGFYPLGYIYPTDGCFYGLVGTNNGEPIKTFIQS